MRRIIELGLTEQYYVVPNAGLEYAVVKTLRGYFVIGIIGTDGRISHEYLNYLPAGKDIVAKIEQTD